MISYVNNNDKIAPFDMDTVTINLTMLKFMLNNNFIKSNNHIEILMACAVNGQTECINYLITIIGNYYEYIP